MVDNIEETKRDGVQIFEFAALSTREIQPNPMSPFPNSINSPASEIPSTILTSETLIDTSIDQSMR